MTEYAHDINACVREREYLHICVREGGIRGREGGRGRASLNMNLFMNSVLAVNHGRCFVQLTQ